MACALITLSYQKDKQEIASIDDQLNDLRRNAAKRLQEKLRQDVTRTRMVELQLIRELAKKTNAATTAAPKIPASCGAWTGNRQSAKGI